MSNPDVYVTERVLTFEVDSDLRLGRPAGMAMMVRDLGTAMGFQLRTSAASIVTEVDAGTVKSSTGIAIALTKAQALTDLADELDPEHAAESDAIWTRGGGRV